MSRRSQLKDYSALVEEFKHASDRAVGILGGAYVEEALLNALLYWIGIESQDRVGMEGEELLGNGAPLATFSNKIVMSEAVRLIGPRTKRDLDIIRKIRNHCAHSVNPSGFDDSPLKDWASSLSPRMLPLQGSNPYLPPASEPRKRFEECCHQLYDQFFNDNRDRPVCDLRTIKFGFELD